MFIDALDAQMYDEHHSSGRCYLSLSKVTPLCFLVSLIQTWNHEHIEHPPSVYTFAIAEVESYFFTGQALLLQATRAACKCLGISQCEADCVREPRDWRNARTTQVRDPERPNVDQMVFVCHDKGHGRGLRRGSRCRSPHKTVAVAINRGGLLARRIREREGFTVSTEREQKAEE